MAVKVPITVEIEKRNPEVVEADQRDFARAESADVSSNMRATWVRFIAWAALTRTGRYAGSWGDFNERDCIEAIDEAVEGDDSLDPGRPARTDGA